MEQSQKEMGTTIKKRSEELGEEGREHEMACEERKQKMKNMRKEKDMSKNKR